MRPVHQPMQPGCARLRLARGHVDRVLQVALVALNVRQQAVVPRPVKAVVPLAAHLCMAHMERGSSELQQ